MKEITFDEAENLIRKDKGLGFANMQSVLSCLDNYPKFWKLTDKHLKDLYGAKLKYWIDIKNT